MLIWETLSVISIVVALAWVIDGAGKKQFRLLVGGTLVAGLLLCWGLVYFGHFSDPASSILVRLAVLDSIAMLELPAVYRKLIK